MQIIFFGEAGSVPERRKMTELISLCETDLRTTPRLESGQSRNGVGAMEAYEIMRTPAIAVVRDDGSPLRIWQGELPSFAELSYYYHS
ncbi:hypothetical protein KBC99_01685 [Candidatus Saccharibacteria bacterium]|nr:hypothetical protein [Candidatus Saccharibacteria bacterium]